MMMGNPPIPQSLTFYDYHRTNSQSSDVSDITILEDPLDGLFGMTTETSSNDVDMARRGGRRNSLTRYGTPHFQQYCYRGPKKPLRRSSDVRPSDNKVLEVTTTTTVSHEAPVVTFPPPLRWSPSAGMDSPPTRARRSVSKGTKSSPSSSPNKRAVRLPEQQPQQ